MIRFKKVVFTCLDETGREKGHFVVGEISFLSSSLPSINFSAQERERERGEKEKEKKKEREREEQGKREREGEADKRSGDDRCWIHFKLIMVREKERREKERKKKKERMRMQSVYHDVF